MKNYSRPSVSSSFPFQASLSSYLTLAYYLAAKIRSLVMARNATMTLFGVTAVFILTFQRFKSRALLPYPMTPSRIKKKKKTGPFLISLSATYLLDEFITMLHGSNFLALRLRSTFFLFLYFFFSCPEWIHGPKVVKLALFSFLLGLEYNSRSLCENPWTLCKPPLPPFNLS